MSSTDAQSFGSASTARGTLDCAQESLVASLDTELLATRVAYSDRFVYSSYFVPLELGLDHDDTGMIVPMVAYNQKVMLLPYFALAPDLIDKALEDEGVHRIFDANNLALTRDRIDRAEMTVRRAELQEDLEAARESEQEGSTTSLRRLLDSRTSTAMDMDTLSHQLAVVPADEQLDLLRNLLRTQVGWLFLDRTRIRPKGFAVGEHLHALSMAPGEEVTIEQKAFSKRQTTYEEQTEQERQFDLELSSTLSTELQEGMDQQVNRTSNGANGGLAGISGFDVQINLFDIANFQKFKTTEAHTDTTRRSIKDSQSVTSKVTSKYRSLHKITFKVSAEAGFERTEKRVIRNPNRFTPLQLHYFKVLQRLEMTQERYGLRLCWTPCVQDPGRDMFRRIQEGRAAIVQRAEDSISVPGEPPFPSRAGAEPRVVSGKQNIGAWNLDGSTRDPFTPIMLDIPAGFVWDQSLVNARVTVTSKISTTRLGTPVITAIAQVAQQLLVQVAITVSGRTGWQWADPNEWEPVTLEAFARFVPDPAAQDPEFQKAIEEWQAARREWEKDVAGLRSEARATGVATADVWEADALRQVNPLSEMMIRFIADNFPSAVRNECWEVDLWHKVFDWPQATFRLFPGWWSGAILRDPSKDALHLFNASWARLYIPVNVGYELIALRQIFGRIGASSLDRAHEAAFKDVIEDISGFRKDNFGLEEVNFAAQDECPIFEEKTICLARWSDTLPTDGTHLEVVQGGTSAVDCYTERELAQTDELRELDRQSREQDVEIKKNAAAQITDPVSVRIVIPGSSESS